MSNEQWSSTHGYRPAPVTLRIYRLGGALMLLGVLLALIPATRLLGVAAVVGGLGVGTVAAVRNRRERRAAHNKPSAFETGVRGAVILWFAATIVGAVVAWIGGSAVAALAGGSIALVGTAIAVVWMVRLGRDLRRSTHD